MSDNQLPDRLQVEVFHFFSCPGCFSEKSQTGFYAGIKKKAIHRNPLAQFFPSISVYEEAEDVFKRFAMKWIVGLLFLH
jgi:hypothetical protein